MIMDFFQDDYDNYDIPAKEALARYLQSIGHIPTIRTEDYGLDLISTIPHYPKFPDITWNWEVSMLIDTVWTSKRDYPHEKVCFAGRKQKLGNNFWYALVCKQNPKRMVIAHSRTIYWEGEKRPLKIKKGKRKGLDDVLYCVSKHACVWV